MEEHGENWTVKKKSPIPKAYDTLNIPGASLLVDNDSVSGAKKLVAVRRLDCDRTVPPPGKTDSNGVVTCACIDIFRGLGWKACLGKVSSSLITSGVYTAGRSADDVDVVDIWQGRDSSLAQSVVEKIGESNRWRKRGGAKHSVGDSLSEGHCEGRAHRYAGQTRTDKAGCRSHPQQACLNPREAE